MLPKQSVVMSGIVWDWQVTLAKECRLECECRSTFLWTLAKDIVSQHCIRLGNYYLISITE